MPPAFLKVKRHKNRYVVGKMVNEVFDRHGLISVANPLPLAMQIKNLRQ